jgi:hypothetical protein
MISPTFAPPEAIWARFVAFAPRLRHHDASLRVNRIAKDDGTGRSQIVQVLY